jgi:RNAse (barnase) inhibitor barstar
MSGLAAVIAGKHGPGVHHWHSGLEVADVRHSVEHAGWTFGYVDGVALEDKREVLRAIGDALAFPDHYGANFDALRDCLRDVAEPTVLLWEGWGSLARAEPEVFEKVCRVLGNRDGGPPFEVLLRGPGPDTGLESLD